MKSSKMKNKPVYLCPYCNQDVLTGKFHALEWERTGNKKKPVDWKTGKCLNVRADLSLLSFMKSECTYLASQAECAFFLKHLYGKPGITDIEIHPRVHFEPFVFIEPYGFLPRDFRVNWPLEMTYDLDFRYKKDGVEMWVDVKGKVNPKTGQPRIINPKAFRINCMLAEKIFSQDVLVYASGAFWKWNDKPWRGPGSRGKKLEVIG
jgi:hypothetical protein